MSNLRRPPGPVRQLSLQQPPRRQQVRRQRSAEDDKPLQVFANPIRTRLQCQDGKVDPDRPKVRVAWDESHETVSNGVSVIARQIPGKLRPPTAKTKVTTRPIIGEKASILYSRQELAERLRLAWKQREENRANIDIFLAQNAVESNCDSRPTSCATSTTSARRKLPVARTILANEPVSEATSEKEPMVLLEKIETELSDVPVISQDLINVDETVRNDEKVDRPDAKSEQDEIDDIEEELRAEEDAVRDITLGDWPPSPSSTSKNKKINEDGDVKESLPNARTKRANFSNKLFTSGPVPVPNRFKESVTVGSIDGKNRRTNSAPPQQRRQGSSSGRTQVSIVIDTPGVSQSQDGKTIEVIPSISNRTIKSAPLKRRTKSGKRRAGIVTGGVSDGVRGDGEEEVQSDGKSRRSGTKGRPAIQTKVPDVVTMVSLVSSADSDSDIDQNSPRDDKLIHELRSKLPTTPIIKTSSVSPAIAVLRKPIKSVSFQQESSDCERDEAPKEDRRWGVVGVFGQQRFPVVCRSGGSGSALPTAEEATSWKLEETTTTLFTTGRVETKENDDTLATPVTDREKRCLAVPIGDPIRDKKRRLLRTRSTPPRPYGPDERLNSPESSPPAETIGQIPRHREIHENSIEKTTNNELPVLKADRTNLESGIVTEPEAAESGLTSSEPQFQTRKERECWHLYRRMCDKGVYVSFDTVLRGMLTPTEYRLRQKEASPEC